MSLKIKFIAFFSLLFIGLSGLSQEGKITINQDKDIVKLLDLKKEMNKDENNSDRYKIQIYSGGNRSDAQDTKKTFSETFNDWRSTLQYESPNFKVWAGNFRTRLEADRALKRIKKEFPSAFIFKPKKEKN